MHWLEKCNYNSVVHHLELFLFFQYVLVVYVSVDLVATKKIVELGMVSK